MTLVSLNIYGLIFLDKVRVQIVCNIEEIVVLLVVKLRKQKAAKKHVNQEA